MPASVPISTLHFSMHPGYDYRAKQEVIFIGTWCDYYATMCERTNYSAGMAYSGCGKNENQVGRRKKRDLRCTVATRSAASSWASRGGRRG